MTYADEIQFIKDLYRHDSPVPLHAPFFPGNEKKYLDDCIDSTFVSSVGRYVDRFEADMAEYTGAAGAVVCVNGTMAVFLALKCDQILKCIVAFVKINSFNWMKKLTRENVDAEPNKKI